MGFVDDDVVLFPDWAEEYGFSVPSYKQVTEHYESITQNTVKKFREENRKENENWINKFREENRRNNEK